METATIDGKRFERNDAGLFLPADSVKSVEDLAWFHRFKDALHGALLPGKKPGLVVPVQSQGLSGMKFSPGKDLLNFTVDGVDHQWRRLGRAASYWHYDECSGARPPSYRARSFVMINNGPENPLRESWMRKGDEALRSVHGNLAEESSALGLHPLMGATSWEEFEEATRDWRRFNREIYAKITRAVDEQALRFKWGEWAHTALYCNNAHYVHRGVYLPEDEEADVGFLYRHIAA